MGHLEIVVSGVVVADEGSAVGSHNHRRRHTYVIGCSVYRCESGGGAGQVGAVGYLEIAVGLVEVADEASAVGSDNH